MKHLLKRGCLVLCAVATFGCAQNYYNIPRETYQKKVRVLGVAPILVDESSDIKHPEKDALITLIKESNRKNEKDLVSKLKDTGSYFSVGLLAEDPDQLFSRLFFRRERRDDAGIIYNKYFYKLPELKELIVKNTIDAVMMVVVSGLTRPEKVYSSNYLAFLQSDYNYLIISAQILDAEGNILWEYPNFRKRSLSFPPLTALQYPDFDEADANLNDQVDIKFKTIPGLTRTFNKTDSSLLKKDTKISSIYSGAFDEMVTLLTTKQFPWSDNSPEKKDVPKKDQSEKDSASRSPLK